MKVWYPNKDDLKKYIDTFNVQDRPRVKETLKKAIVEYDRLLASHKSSGKLTASHQTFGAFLSYLDVNESSKSLFLLEDEIYGFSRWVPNQDDLDYYDYKGLWPQLVEHAMLECSMNANGTIVEDPEAYFSAFLARKYNFEHCDPYQNIPNHILKVMERTTGRPVSIILSLIKNIREQWIRHKSQHLHPRYYYRFVVSELAKPADPKHPKSIDNSKATININHQINHVTDQQSSRSTNSSPSQNNLTVEERRQQAGLIAELSRKYPDKSASELGVIATEQILKYRDNRRP